MRVTAVFPNALRPYVANNDRVAMDANTVGDLLDKLMERYPDLAEHWPRDLAQLPIGAGLYRNRIDVRKLQGLTTPLVQDDVVTLIVPVGEL